MPDRFWVKFRKYTDGRDWELGLGLISFPETLLSETSVIGKAMARKQAEAP